MDNLKQYLRKSIKQPLSESLSSKDKAFLGTYGLTVDPLILAYADTAINTKQHSREAYNSAVGFRNLRYRDKRWMDIATWEALMKEATPNDYNMFNARTSAMFLRRFNSNLKLQPARESSVCVYVKGFDDLAKLKELADNRGKAYIDEFSIPVGSRNHIRLDELSLEEIQKKVRNFSKSTEVRLWWD